MMAEGGGAKRRRDVARRPQTVQSAARAVRIMRSLFLAREGKHLNELSEELGLHKTTVLRLLRTLMAEGVVRKEPVDGHYRIHPLLWIMVATRMPTVSLTGVIQELLDELATGTGATAVIAAPTAGARAMVATMWAAPRRAVHVEPMGLSAPMHACAPGKCYLASLPEDELRAWLRRPLNRVTEHTITSSEQLLKQIHCVRERGYALDREEFVVGAASLAVPIADERGTMVAALTLASPEREMTKANKSRWVPILLDASSRLSQALTAIDASELTRPTRGGERSALPPAS